MAKARIGGKVKYISDSSKDPEANYTRAYEPRKRGQITKFEAGVVYRAAREGNIKALPETTRLYYSETEASYRFADERYNQNHLFYDRTEGAVRAILNQDYKRAQQMINDIEESLIKGAGKKSPYYKYRG